MYTPESRQQALQKIIEICRDINHVEGIVLVGSGGEEFPDRWADIDIVVFTVFD